MKKIIPKGTLLFYKLGSFNKSIRFVVNSDEIYKCYCLYLDGDDEQQRIKYSKNILTANLDFYTIYKNGEKHEIKG